jgi:sulfur relay protein TusB/DsrH
VKIIETKNSIIYLYGFSPNLGNKSSSFLKILKEQLSSDLNISVVMIHDGVLATNKKSKTPDFLEDLLNFPIKLYALIPDIIARGMDHKDLIDKINGIGYEELVDLLIESNKIVSWM